MNDNKIKLKAIVDKAIVSFNAKEEYLIRNDLSERCICSRFMLHLTNALKSTKYSDYVVDVEYNRGADGQERNIKRIDNSPITVDLIVHKRGYDCNNGFNNLICIEMKKSSDRRGLNDDKERLRKMTGYDYGFCYKTGFMIVIDMENKALVINEQF